MSKIIVSKVDEVYFKLTGLDVSMAMELKEHLSCMMTNYFFHPKFKTGVWDGKLSFFNWNDHTIPIGLWPQFIKFCKKYNYEYECDFGLDEVVNDISEEEIEDFYKTIFKESSFYPREYQHESIYKAITRKRGVIESATGSGKSIVLYCVIRFLLGICEGKILLIVPNVSLVNQMYSDFEEYGWSSVSTFCSKIFHKSDKIDWNCPIIISTWQSIFKKSPKFFEQFQAVLVDESHGSKASSINSCLKKCVNAEYRIGCTGTMPDEIDYQYTIYGYLGPKIFSLKSSSLIDKGILSKIKIANLVLRYPKNLVYNYWHDAEGKIDRDDYQQELSLIYGIPERNYVFKYILDHCSVDDNFLILCHQIEHLNNIEEFFKENFPNRNVSKIYGAIDPKKREEIRKSVNQSGSNIICGTFNTMAVGINVPRLHHVIFASSYKSKIKVIQSIGRGLRKHETKSQLIVWDIVDDLTWVNKWHDKEIVHENLVYKHWKERKIYYNAQGFKYITKMIKVEDINI